MDSVHRGDLALALFAILVLGAIAIDRVCSSVPAGDRYVGLLTEAGQTGCSVESLLPAHGFSRRDLGRAACAYAGDPRILAEVARRLAHAGTPATKR